MNPFRSLCLFFLAFCLGGFSLAAAEKTNRLVDEKSPYLLQHARNPIDWYPWGEEAFEKARKENKPIFLSVGYSTCHWCHVMERESFENPEIAKIMNEHFVNIKVDREERPDVDRVYMAFVQATTGSGGWPMNVWLTPELKPFFGGTYFPPKDAHGRPGFPSILKQIAEDWKGQKDAILASANDVTKALSEYTMRSAGTEDALPADASNEAFKKFASQFDEKLGGFGPAPKFPRPVTLNFLFRAYHSAPDSKEGKQALEMALTTLREMAKGGMHDQLGGGFHRYSVDKFWHVPHFEKMLYDQAQLAEAYLTAYQITREPVFERTARDILDYVKEDMTGDGGGFYSAEDADSVLERGKPEHAEGAFYVWEEGEIEELLGPEPAELFSYFYGVEPKGNAPEESDPHGEFTGKNILIQRHTVPEAAEKFGLSEEEVSKGLAASREILLAQREERPRPHLDDKVLTAWNGLMISAFSRGYQVLGEESYLSAAKNAAGFLREHLYDSDSGTLLRSYREGAGDVEGFADDYAYLIQGLIDLYESSFDVGHLAWALKLQERQNALFMDSEGGGYYATTGTDPSVLLRMKEDHDAAEPSPNSVAALNLQRLGYMLDKPEWRELAGKTMRAFGTQLKEAPTALPQMLVALDWYRSSPQQIVIAGRPGAPDTDAMLKEVYRNFLPNKVLILADGAGGQEFFSERVEFLKSVHAIDGKATAYVCENFVCQLPTTEVSGLAELLAKKKVD